MTAKKAKKFPLPLSSVVEAEAKKRMPASTRQDRQAMPQTAARNPVRGVSPARKTATSLPEVRSRVPHAPLKRSFSSGADSGMLVSNVVRHSMVERLAGQGIMDAKVLAAMGAAPRHLFLDPALASQAYIDASLPIGHHQTISQPYIVARMIEVLRDNRQGGVLNSVLEIGTGCGYQALVLSMVAKEVYSIERIKGLHELAKNRLRPLRVPNIRLHYGDGMLGLPQAAPFDGIILAAAGLEVPQTLLDQLIIGGRLVAPVGGSQQSLQLIERVSATEWQKTVLEDCHFVPLLAGTV
jgi:protein-L-isoaspartate(D-aspartate) O-methyltransferase